MTTESAFDRAVKILREPAFLDTARESIQDYLSPSELASREVPEGLTREEHWELLTAIRRLGATTFPIPVVTGEEFWYTITIEGRQCLRAIERHCRSDSRLHQMVQRRTGQRFLVSSQVQEAIATCLADGVEADVPGLASMLNEGSPPNSAAQRLVKNNYEMLGEMPSLAGEEFSPELVSYLFARATHKVATNEIPRSDHADRAVPPVFHEFTRAYRAKGRWPDRGFTDRRAEGMLQRICDYANGRIGDPRESVAVRGYMLLAAIGYWRPLPDFNATVARHMLRLLSVKEDSPVLGYLPVSAMMRRWASGQLGPEIVRYSAIEPAPPTPDGIDGTAEILVHLQLTVAAINELRARIQSAKEEDEGLSSTMGEALHLNYRQLSVLNHALKRPTTEFALREHRLTYRTVYSTARADLLELVEMGLLMKQTRGQAFVFTPAPDLRGRLSRGCGEAE